MTQSVPDRMAKALRGINDAISPDLAYALTWEYSVIAVTQGPPVTIDCEAVDPETQLHLPAQLVGLTLWPGPCGCIAVPQPGSLVRVGFVNGDPSKPFVCGLDPNSSPTLVMLDGTIGQPVARVGDKITITPDEVVAAAMIAAGAGSVTAGSPLVGTITSGSAIVTSP